MFGSTALDTQHQNCCQEVFDSDVPSEVEWPNNFKLPPSCARLPVMSCNMRSKTWAQEVQPFAEGTSPFRTPPRQHSGCPDERRPGHRLYVSSKSERCQKGSVKAPQVTSSPTKRSPFPLNLHRQSSTLSLNPETRRSWEHSSWSRLPWTWRWPLFTGIWVVGLWGCGA